MFYRNERSSFDMNSSLFEGRDKSQRRQQSPPMKFLSLFDGGGGGSSSFAPDFTIFHDGAVGSSVFLESR